MFFIAAALSVQTFAAATVESSTGDVRAGASPAAASTVSKDQRILPGTVVTTGPNSQVVLRFDDGQAMALGANTEFRVAEYHFEAAQPAKDSFVFELLRGAARSITGALSQRSPRNYSLRLPTATIGIRGTDFMVAQMNSGFVQVTNGAIDVTNSAGSVTFGPGSVGTVASSTTLATTITAAALPAAVSSAFAQLGALPLSAVGAGQAVGAATGGISGAAMAGIAIGVAAVAAIANDNNNNPSPSTATATGTR